MSGIKEQDRIEALRKRLYERGTPSVTKVSHKLTSTTPIEKEKQQWKSPPTPIKKSTPVEQPDNQPSKETYIPMISPAKRNTYRLRLLLAGILFFVVSVGLSSMFLMFGNNNISAENITISVTGPFTIGGGAVLPLQVGITNDNTVDIESATLIVEYPRGTLSAGEDKQELNTEHLALDTISSGETVNIPLRSTVFGEENDEKIIKVSIEYRVQGSNATFFKEADVLRFKISSSPVIIKVAGLKKVSSGQETEIELEVTSNAPTTLSEVLVKAEYPIGFDFTSSNPKPTGSQNIWLIKNLEPEETKKITITGIVVGKETDEYAINFSVGVPSERSQQTLASVFATTQTEFEIEEPFLNIALEVGGVINGEVVVEAGQRAGAQIEIENTLNDTLYDLEVEVLLDGNALSDLNVGPPNGFYDSLNNKIIWDVSNAPDLAELHPGKKLRLSFALEPSGDVLCTPAIKLTVNVRARRVSETEVSETLLGTAQSVMKVASSPDIRTDVGFNSGAFSDSGLVPPVAEKSTSYTVSFMVKNGSNDITQTAVTATLPTYVTWENQTTGAGDISYDSVKRTVTWNVGSVDANAAAFASFQIDIVPSKSQIGTTPTLVSEQRLRANDRFTGTVVRDVSPAVTTEMSPEGGHSKGNGRVQEN